MSIVYEPRAIVWHSHRIDREAFRSQMRQYIRGHVAALLVQFEKHRHFGNLRRLLATMPYDYCRRLTRVRFKSDWSLLFDELLGFRFRIRQLFSSIPSEGFQICPAHKCLLVLQPPNLPCLTATNLACPISSTTNPFPHPYTQGLFYREKNARAIHRIAPDRPIEKVFGSGRWS